MAVIRQTVRINYILNLINTGAQLLVPLICFPYASRILQPVGIGKVGFMTSIIEYILLFVNLGIPMYAIREIAKVRDDMTLRSKTAIEILSLLMLMSLVGYVVVGMLCLFVPQIYSDIPLFLVLSTSVFLTAIGSEWFYQGIEDFLYVTVRGIAFKLLSVLILFTCVNTKDDVIYYGLFTVVGVYGGYLLNFLKLRKYISIRDVKVQELHPFKHLKPSLGTFAFSITSTAYLMLNPTILGIFKQMEDVGYFTAATKLMFWGVRIVSCLGVVMMPHISNLLANHQDEEFKKLAQKSYDFVLLLSVPLVVILFFSSESAVYLLCGDQFAPAVLTAQIISPVVLFTGISNVVGYQILYPLGNIKYMLGATLLGFALDLLLNLLLIPDYSYNGTAVAYLIAEVGTAISLIWMSRHQLPLRFLGENVFQIFVSVVIMSIGLYVVYHAGLNSFLEITAMVLVGSVLYVLSLLVMRHKIVGSLFDKASLIKLGHRWK